MKSVSINYQISMGTKGLGHKQILTVHNSKSLVLFFTCEMPDSMTFLAVDLHNSYY